MTTSYRKVVDQLRALADLAKKKLLGPRILRTFCGLADFERSADHGFLQYFSMDDLFCLF